MNNTKDISVFEKIKQENSAEEWQEVYPNYFLSNLGRWFSAKTEKILKTHKNSSNYERVHISLNGVQKNVFTHIKVVEFFGDKNGRHIPKRCKKHLRSVGLSIDHVDRNKSNNSFSNLELVTHVENCLRWRKTPINACDSTDVMIKKV